MFWSTVILTYLSETLKASAKEKEKKLENNEDKSQIHEQ